MNSTRTLSRYVYLTEFYIFNFIIFHCSQLFSMSHWLTGYLCTYTFEFFRFVNVHVNLTLELLKLVIYQ